MNKKKPDEDEMARRLERAHEKIIGNQSPGDLPSGQSEGLGILNLINRVRKLPADSVDSPFNPQALERRDGDTFAQAGDRTGGASIDVVETSNSPVPDIGRFKIKKQIGKGGFGVVFLAHDTRLGRDVALKIPRIEAVTTPELKERFLREGRAAAALAHPNIVPVFEAGEVDGTCYLASKHIVGETLEKLLVDSQIRITPDDAAQACALVAEALGHAHQRGVLHRDIKPANLLVEHQIDDGPLWSRIQITDFGLAKNLAEDACQTQTGALIGTPAYMSPEQVEGGKQVGPQSDVYSLGVVLYRLLTGRLPFEGTTILDVVAAVRTKEPSPLRKLNSKIPRDLEAVCLKCLEKNPATRYQSGFELADDLRRWTRGEPVTARRVSALVRLGRWYQRNTAIAAWVTATCIALIAGMIGTLLMYAQSQQSLVEAKRQTELATKGLERSQVSIDTMLTDVSVSLASIPKMQGLRERLLESALRMNQEILAEQQAGQGTAGKTMESFSRMARLQLELGKLDDALETIAVGLEIFETLPGGEQESETGIANWARLKRFEAQILIENGNDEKSLAVCEELIGKLEGLNSNDFVIQIGLANSYRQAGIALLNNGESKRGAGKFETAIAALDRIDDVAYPDVFEFTRAEVLNSLAIARKTAREPDAAKALYRKVIDIVDELSLKFPERVEYRKMRNIVALNLGNLYYSTSDYAGAEESYQSSLDGWQGLKVDFPSQPYYYNHEIRALNGLGITYAKLNRIDESIDVLEQTIAASIAFEDRFGQSLSSSDTRARSFSNLGNRLLSIKKYDDARIAFEKGLELHRSLAEEYPQRLGFQTSVAVAIGNLGSLEQNIGNFEEALALHRKSLDISLAMMVSNESKEQFFKNVNYQRGMIVEDHYMMGDHEKAFAAARGIITLAPQEPDQHLVAAGCLAGIVMHALDNDGLDQTQKDELTDLYVKEARKYLATAGELGADVDALLKNEPLSVLKL